MLKELSMNEKNLIIRKIEKQDMNNVIELLQLISEFNPDKSEYSNIWNSFIKQNNQYSLVAIINNKIVGYGSVIIEVKIRGGKIGHIEDIVSHPSYRTMGVGKTIVDALFDIAKANNCYKVTLLCKEHNIKFYEKCNYQLSGSGMQRFS